MCALKALVVEDEPDLREMLQYHLMREGFAVESTADGYIALQLAKRLQPDVILLDLLLAGLDGLSLCRQFKRDPGAAGTHVIIISACVEEDDVLRGLAQGADDYVRKPFRPKEVMARVRAVPRRTPVVAGERPDEVLRFPPLELNHASHEVRLAGAPLTLTATEYRILHYLMAHPERVFSRGQLLRHASGGDREAAGRSIDVHVRALRRALGPHAGVIETARGVGYRFRPPGEMVTEAVTAI